MSETVDDTVVLRHECKTCHVVIQTQWWPIDFDVPKGAVEDALFDCKFCGRKMKLLQ